MTPAQCRVTHDPERGSYGDCVRACIATILDYADPEKVPHFYHDGCDGETGAKRINDWLRPMGLAHIAVNFDGSLTLDDILMGVDPNATFILYGCDGSGNHAVVGSGGAIVHNPAWFPKRMIGPASHGFWTVAFLARI